MPHVSTLGLLFRTAIVGLIGALTLVPRGPVTELVIQCSPLELAEIQRQFGAAIIDAIPTADAYLIALPSRFEATDLQSVSNRVRKSRNFDLGMSDAFQPPTANPQLQWNWVPFYSSSAPGFFLDQPAAAQIQALEAHQLSTGRRSIVALIDTGIDETHPVLKKNVVSGRNYVTSGPASEWNDPLVDQSESTVFDLLQSQSTVFDLERGPVFGVLRGNIRGLFISNEYGAFGTGPLPASFGHGTMTAGLVHLVAPNADLMPMKAFGADGRATLWAVIRAVRDAADLGAHVINMSFSAPDNTETEELFKKLAVDYAAASNIALVAAAGNTGQEIEVIPATIEPVNGIAAVTPNDVKASFSNYGKDISFSAPGTGIITTYPGAFAIVSGTSFSAAFVSGLYALLKEDGIEGAAARREIERGSDSIRQFNDPSLKHKLGAGRINAFETLSKCREHSASRGMGRCG